MFWMHLNLPPFSSIVPKLVCDSACGSSHPMLYVCPRSHTQRGLLAALASPPSSPRNNPPFPIKSTPQLPLRLDHLALQNGILDDALAVGRPDPGEPNALHRTLVARPVIFLVLVLVVRFH